MTSKNYFSRCLKQDLSHKKWVFILSAILQFVAVILSLLFLIQANRENMLLMENAVSDNLTEVYIYRKTYSMSSYYGRFVVMLDGMVAGLMAVLAAFYGYMHMLFRRMQDTFGSLPITRKMQFMLLYLGGLFNFLVPCLVCFGISIPIALAENNRFNRALPESILSKVQLSGIQQSLSNEVVLRSAGKSLVCVLLIFFVIYHLSILAMTLSGNYLNAAVLTALLGVLPAIAVAVKNIFCSTFYDSYYLGPTSEKLALQVSPLFQPFLLLSEQESRKAIPLMLFTALILLFLSCFLYKNRKSEMAHRGVECKWLCRVLQVFTAFVSGSVGYIIMSMMMELFSGKREMSVVWSFLGTMFGAMISFCLLNMIFEMNPKSIFKYKRYLIITALVVFCVCYGCENDVTGFDYYLPREDRIVSMTIWDENVANGYGSYYAEDYGQNYTLKHLILTNQEDIYNYLERMVQNQKKIDENNYEGSYYWTKVKVTLRNGKVYYRNYVSSYSDKDVKEPLYTSEEYKDTMFRLNPELVGKNATYISVTQETNEVYLEFESRRDSIEDMARELAQAYNKDVAEHPEKLWCNEDALLCRITITGEGIRDQGAYACDEAISIDVREGMVNTIAALKKWGCEEATKKLQITEDMVLSFEFYIYDDMEAMRKDLAVISKGDFESCEKSTAPGTEYNYNNSYGAVTVRMTISDPEVIREISEGFRYESSFWFYGMTEDFAYYFNVVQGEKSYSVALKEHSIPPEYIKALWEEINNADME